jgi:hypothetical protein
LLLQIILQAHLLYAVHVAGTRPESEPVEHVNNLLIGRELVIRRPKRKGEKRCCHKKIQGRAQSP